MCFIKPNKMIVSFINFTIFFYLVDEILEQYPNGDICDEDADIEMPEKFVYDNDTYIEMPERMQSREFPIACASIEELTEEAAWIFDQAFDKASILNQTQNTDSLKRPTNTITKIIDALQFIRNELLEVPFIAFYRKKYVQPELNISDLWKIYDYDASWCHLLLHKKALKPLLEKMRKFQLDMSMKNPCHDFPNNVRHISDDDIKTLENVQTAEELKNVHMQFGFYYGHHIPAMRREELINTLEGVETAVNDVDILLEKAFTDAYNPRLLRTGGPLAIFANDKICNFIKNTEMTTEQFLMNIKVGFILRKAANSKTTPSELAIQYTSEQFPNANAVLAAAKNVVATQISYEPALKKFVRAEYFQSASVNVTPTERGQKEIDENHPLYTMKYLIDKPVSDLSFAEYLRLQMAEDDKLLTFSIKFYCLNINSYVSELRYFETDSVWNSFCADCIEFATNEIIIPNMQKELRSTLLTEAKEAILKECSRKMQNWIQFAPYTANLTVEANSDLKVNEGARILGLAYDGDSNQAIFCALIQSDGEVSNFCQLSGAHLFALKNFIKTEKPHVIAIGGESFKAAVIQEDIRKIVNELVDDEQFPNIPVEIVENHLAKIYGNSKKGCIDFPEHSAALRQAISIARRLQDPLIEFSQLCSTDNEILSLHFHPLQSQLTKEELLKAIQIEFINRTNQVGIDINQVVKNSFSQCLVQFICGLGPRAGSALIKVLKQKNSKLENRTQLKTVCHMEPKIFENCSGFIKIVAPGAEFLDGSRVHPENYDWAEKLAAAALEADGLVSIKTGTALKALLESPHRSELLDEINLEASEFKKQGEIN